MALLPLAEAFDASDVQVPEGWTQKDIRNIVREAQERIQYLLKSRINSLDLAIEKFSRMKTIVATLPSWADDASYFDFINGKLQSQICSSEDVKMRSRMEWENSVKIRTGKRRRQTDKAAPLSLSVKTVVETTMDNSIMPTVPETSVAGRNRSTTARKRKANDILAPSQTFSTAAKRSSRRQAATKPIPTVSSTPIQQPTGEPTAFIMPTTHGRATRYRNGPLLRVNPRVIHPQDTIQSTRGSVVQNPFSLRYARNAPKPKPDELERLRELVSVVSGYLKEFDD